MNNFRNIVPDESNSLTYNRSLNLRARSEDYVTKTQQILGARRRAVILVLALAIAVLLGPIATKLSQTQLSTFLTLADRHDNK